MSTDELMEQRLREAGERWRSAHAAPADVDLSGVADRGRGPGRRRMLLAAVSGVAVAAAVVAGVLFAVHRSPGGSAAIPAIGPSPSSGQRPLTTPAAAATDPAVLQGGTWRLQSIEQRHGSSTSDSGSSSYSRATLRFAGNTITISDGCASTTAHVDAGAGTLDIAQYVDGGLTQPSCADLDRTLDAVLIDRTAWRIGGNQLTVTKGDTSLVYQRSK